MAKARVLSQAERERVLAKVKPSGDFETPRRGAVGQARRGVHPIMWEARLGDLNEWRQHQGMGRSIVPIMANALKTQAVRNSIANRLKKLHPNESWTTYISGKFIYLKFNGGKRTRSRRDNSTSDSGSELFSQIA